MTGFSQSRETVEAAALPDRLAGLERMLVVTHFPETVNPIEDSEKVGLYHWKHTTTVYCETSSITIDECGAFLYYNDQWNLRTAMGQKEMDKLFGTRKGEMLQAEPYVFVKNWRSGSEVFAGWAMWYFIGTNEQGQRVCGYKPLFTSAETVEKPWIDYYQ